MKEVLFRVVLERVRVSLDKMKEFDDYPEVRGLLVSLFGEWLREKLGL